LQILCWFTLLVSKIKSNREKKSSGIKVSKQEQEINHKVFQLLTAVDEGTIQHFPISLLRTKRAVQRRLQATTGNRKGEHDPPKAKISENP